MFCFVNRRKMRYPDFLKDNGNIGFVAPAFGCASEPYKSAFDNALKKLHAMGFGTHEGSNCRMEKGIGISNTPQKCAKELMYEYTNPQNDILMSCGGGELMCEVVPYIDFEKIKAARPRWFMGYSDNTNFTYLSVVLSDTAAVYGPCAPAFGMEEWHPSLYDAMDFLGGRKLKFSNYDSWEIESLKNDKNPLAVYNTTEMSCIKPSVDGKIKISGRVIGGCLDCLSNLIGTKFDKTKEFCEKYKEDGQIWFLEACDLNPVSVRRALWQLKNAGWFENARGFLFGRSMHFGEEMFGIDQYNAITDSLEDLGVPVIMDLDIGHLPPMMPIVVGALADTEFSDGKFTIEYKLS
jgi:muramoyltetrapeptide carboxypeptidase